MLPNISTATVHRWGTGHKRCPARARRTNVPPWSPLGGRWGGWQGGGGSRGGGGVRHLRNEGLTFDPQVFVTEMLLDKERGAQRRRGVASPGLLGFGHADREAPHVDGDVDGLHRSGREHAVQQRDPPHGPCKHQPKRRWTGTRQSEGNASDACESGIPYSPNAPGTRGSQKTGGGMEGLGKMTGGGLENMLCTKRRREMGGRHRYIQLLLFLPFPFPPSSRHSPPDIAINVRQLRHDHKEPRPTEFCAGCSCFLLRSGCDRSRYY